MPATGDRVSCVWGENRSTVIAAKSCAFIEQHQHEHFFLEVATHNIHVPRVPNPKFRGKSDCGVRGDVIVKFDWTVGQVLDALDRLKFADNTLVILTSDDGSILDANGAATEHGGTVESNNAPVSRTARWIQSHSQPLSRVGGGLERCQAGAPPHP